DQDVSQLKQRKGIGLTDSDEYQLFLGQVNKLTERRQAVTTAYLSVNAAIVGALAFLFKDVQMPGWAQQASALVLLMSGIIACDLWRRLIAQYRSLLVHFHRINLNIEDPCQQGEDDVSSPA
ncbi:MAG: hypothetical protein DRI79_07765, partial [Chloroflexi bacterium]